jgi:riboflavin synthase
MFTGIVEEVGVVASVEPLSAGGRLRILCRKVLKGTSEGASISVNGVCLTAVDLRPDSFAADVSPETLSRSNLGELAEGAEVNLERALAAGDRLGGHIMQGHIDGTGELASFEELGDGNWWLRVTLPAEMQRYVVFKGSIGMDGISLTVAEVEENMVSVAVIPHTVRNTNLRRRRPGDRLNIECDILAKYVEKLLGAFRAGAGKLTLERMHDLGY